MTDQSLLRGALALALAVLAACGRSSTASVAAPPVPAPAPLLISAEARLLEMLDQRRMDTALVDVLLADTSGTLRARTALAVGQNRIRLRYPALRRLLLDGDTAIAANAAYALGIARDYESVPALARAVGGAPDAVAREAAWALGEMGEMGRTVILQSLGEGLGVPVAQSPIAVRAPLVRAAMVLATVKLRNAPMSVVTPWLADPSPDVVRAAAYVVGRLRAPAGVRAMFAVAAYPDEEVRQYAARAFARSAAGDSLAPRAREALKLLLRDENERVRINATQSAASYGAVMAEELDVRWRDPVRNVRVTLAESFADVGARDLARWQRAWDADTMLAVRRLLLQQARKNALPLFAGVEMQWARHADWRYRVASMGSAERGALMDSTVPRLLENDPDRRVRREAMARLAPRQSAAPTGPRSTTPVARPLADYEQLVQRYWRQAESPRAIVETEQGTITLELFGDEAPLVVEAFTRLAQTGRYRNTTFHRVVPNFVVQDGDIANGDGDTEPPFTLRESWTRRRHGRGCLGLATAGPDTGGSQFYFCHSTQPHLDGGYTVFGRVIDGFDVMDRLVQGDRMIQVRIP
ncbi:peptidylprolyl isomerase [Gemmatimonas sp.]|jgi:cyclophilin family peptidyl-prolyl cis-trans isomerase|uniref:peptidylprolyl isomerase n=1 Tax=Gemmatimonas sp. TaxID=1962908 RepID=UPI0037C0A04E